MDAIMKDLVVLVESNRPVDHILAELDKHSTAYTAIYSDEPAGQLLKKEFYGGDLTGIHNGVRVFTGMGNLKSWLRKVGAVVENEQAPQIPEYEPQPLGMMNLIRDAGVDAHEGPRREMFERAQRINAILQPQHGLRNFVGEQGQAPRGWNADQIFEDDLMDGEIIDDGI